VRWTEETLIAAWDAKHPSKGPAKRKQTLITRHRRIKRELGAIQRVVRDEEYPLTVKARSAAVSHINALYKLLNEVEAKHPEWKTPPDRHEEGAGANEEARRIKEGRDRVATAV
jgi:DNA-binding FrmR family transcriptional regulator